jgi:hypothetical protein
MGTTLTGTTPQDTYDSLIKVTDNGPISATAKYLSDGLGNDSILALSNARVGVGTASPSVALHTNGVVRSANSGNTIYSELMNDGVYAAGTDLYLLAPATKFVAVYAGNAERMRLTSAGNVGIGLNNPAAKLVVSDSVSTAVLQVLRDGGTNGEFTISFPSQQATLNSQVSDMVFQTIGAERIRINANGLTFNGDTAAANALDDYEEGTFTATLKGGVSDPTTPVTTTGTYTKIGRQVTVNVIFSSVNTTGASGAVSITGMPFAASGISNGAVNCFQFTFPTNTSLASYIGASSTLVELLISGTNANWEDLTHSAGGSRFLWTTLTYFV